jgi:hypothetical protein
MRGLLDNPGLSSTKAVKIVGGGFTGILAAFQAHRLGVRKIELHERFDQLGGVALPHHHKGRELREGCIYFGPPGDPIRTILEEHGVEFLDFDNRFGSMSSGVGEPIFVADFGGPALPSAEIQLNPLRGSGLADRIACYPDTIATSLNRYARWHLGCEPADIHESAAIPLAINRVFPVHADLTDLAKAKRTDELSDELLAIPRSAWGYVNNAQASLPKGGFTGLLKQCREALDAIGVSVSERHLVTPRQALAEFNAGEVLVWAASPTPLFKQVSIPTPPAPPKLFATYVFEANWTGPVPFYVQNFTAEGSCFRVYIYEAGGSTLLTAECVTADAGEGLVAEMHRMLDGFEGELTVGELIHSTAKPRWIYHSLETMDRLADLRRELSNRFGPDFVPGAWEPYSKGEKFAEVGTALGRALGDSMASAA